MEQLKTLIESSQGLGAFDRLLQTLADALNVSVQQLQQNLPEYLHQFGAYQMIGNMPGIIVCTLLLGGICMVPIFVALFGLFQIVKKEEDKAIQSALVTSSIIYITIFMITLYVYIYYIYIFDNNNFYFYSLIDREKNSGPHFIWSE